MITCIAIDDEPLALKQIEGYIEKTPFLSMKGSFESAIEATEFLHSISIDLMFVDINMPDLNGLEFVKSLTSSAPKVIFTTAYSEFAVEGFRVDALDYLLKPIDYAMFLKSANKAKAWFGNLQNKEIKVEGNSEFLFIKSEYKIVRIILEDIKFIEGKGEYIRIHLVNQKPIMSLISLTKVENHLPEEKFMRVHRSYIVNLKRIITIDRSRIVFDNKEFIPVSDQYRSKFQEYINRNFLL
jgi:two-component system, LytTR family, response regulator LytT